MPASEWSDSPVFERKVRLTRLGAHFLFVACFAMFGGALRGFNLLLVIAGILVGAVLMQWRWSRAASIRLAIHRIVPSEVFAGNPFTVEYTIGNMDRWLTFSMLRIEDRAAVIGNNPIEAAVIRSNRGPTTVHSQLTIGKLRRMEAVTYRYRFHSLSRGEWSLGPLAVTTTDPLDLMACHVAKQEKETILVYPGLVPLRRDWQKMLTSRRGGSISATQRGGRGEGVFFGLREWRNGDKLRWIHWRTTARMNEPVVCQYDRPRRYDICLLLDAFLGADADDDSNVELAISVVATMIMKLASENSNRVVLAVSGKTIASALSNGAIKNQKHLLQLLAKIQPSDSPRLFDAVEDAAKRGRIKDIVVVSPRTQEAALESMSPSSRERFDRLISHAVLRWINVSDQETRIVEAKHHA